MVASRTLIIAVTLLILGTHTAKAEDYYPLITYKCDTTADIILLTNSLLPDNKGKNYPYLDSNGSYSPWHLVDIERTEKSVRITSTRKLVKTCKLSSGEYHVTIEPHVFNRDLTGQCGETISAAVTIEQDGSYVQERIPLEPFCLGNAPVISKLKLDGKSGRVKLKRIPRYKYY